MSASLKYAATGVVGVGLVVAGLWPFLDGPGRTGVLIAAAVAIPVQVGAFAALNGSSDRLEGFMAAWVGGTLVRMAVVGVVAFVVIRSDVAGAVPLLLALAGFFFGLLLLEPMYFRLGPSKTS